jgi:hypothetical protein
LFSSICGHNQEATFLEKKEIFFQFLKQLLDQGKVKFCPPNELWHDGYDVWDADTMTILDYLLSRWPVDISSEKDIKLTNYFYDMPAILWVASDGTLHGS